MLFRQKKSCALQILSIKGLLGNLRMLILGTFLVAQWLRLCSFTAKGWGSIPSWGTKLCGVARKKKIKKKVSYSDYYCYYFIPLPSFLSLKKKKKTKKLWLHFSWSISNLLP